MPKNESLIHCEQLEYECPFKWTELKPTDDINTRFCNECSQKVYLCITEGDIEKHAKQGHCVAIRSPPPVKFMARRKLDGIRLMLGIPVRNTSKKKK